jgi:regulator of cell morphogenesis and NO signaling
MRGPEQGMWAQEDAMSETTTMKTVRDVALENPGAARVFEKLGIDYCCGGGKSLQEACRDSRLDFDDVCRALQAAEQAGPSAPRNWGNEPLADLIAHINTTHHVYTREEISRLQPLFDKVCSVHGKNHPELLAARSTFQALAAELRMHMMKEEMVLFPYIIRLEEAVLEHTPVVPPPFGSVRNPVAMMEHEHDSAGQALRALRQATNGYAPPEDACVSFQTLYRALTEFEADLHQHIHLENNILFPRAVVMEQTCA